MTRQIGEIQVLKGDEVVYIHPIGAFAVMIGRRPENDLRLADARVSSHHLVLRWFGDRLLAHDLGSKNGTFINDVLVTNPTPVADQDIIRLGSAIQLRICLRPAPPGLTLERPYFVVTDLNTAVVYPVRSNRFRVGSRAGSDLELTDGPAVAATITLHDNGEIWLGTDDDERPLLAGEPFEVAGHRLILREDPGGPDSTVEERKNARTRYPYRLKVDLGAQGEPEATVEDLRLGVVHAIHAENRVALLYVLARQALLDRDRGRGDSDLGWLPDDEAMLGIWGRRRETIGQNNYQVLLCRLRKEINDAGLDGWFIEKRAGCTRVVLDEIQIVGNQPGR